MERYTLALKDEAILTNKDTGEVKLELLPQEYALIMALKDLTNELRRLNKFD